MMCVGNGPLLRVGPFFIVRRYSDAVDVVATIPAVSPAGVRAKATCLRENIEEEIGIAGGECMGDRQHVLAWLLLRYMATVAG
jgi:hypothetical protein